METFRLLADYPTLFNIPGCTLILIENGGGEAKEDEPRPRLKRSRHRQLFLSSPLEISRSEISGDNLDFPSSCDGNSRGEGSEGWISARPCRGNLMRSACFDPYLWSRYDYANAYLCEPCVSWSTGLEGEEESVTSIYIYILTREFRDILKLPSECCSFKGLEGNGRGMRGVDKLVL